MSNVVSICGSLRKGSFNRIIEKALPALATEEMKFVPAPSIGDIPHYDADVQTTLGPPAAAEALAKVIRAADGVVIVSPEYNWSIPGALKNAIDWLSRMPDQPFKDKPVAIQSSSPGLLGASRMQYHLRQVLASVDAQVLIKPEMFITFAGTKTNPEKHELTDEPARDMIRQQLGAFEQLISRVHR